ncbi:MAG: methyl-accepting chemotaxis protein [Symbiobacteriaceae bacterium]|nr:methyl-accepting chemotaxis protein [Symbiobacteriaceae bacterium]
MKTKGIGFRLIAVMLCIIILGIIITAGIATTISGNVIIRESLNKVNKSTLYEAERLDSWLSHQLANTNTMAAIFARMDDLAAILTENQANASESLEDQVLATVRPLLKSVLDDNAAYFEIYFGFLDGTAVCGSGYQFNYAGGWRAPERGWYRLAMTDTSRSHITAPYVDDQTGELCITAVRAVINNGRLMGVIGSDIFVTDLLNITLNATLDGSGYSMLLATNGDILIHPDATFAPNSKGEFNNFETFRNGAYANLWRQISISDGGYTYRDSNRIQQHYASRTLAATGWKMVSVIPESVITQPIINVLIIVVPISILILLLATFIVYFEIRSLVSRPLTNATEMLRQASESISASAGQLASASSSLADASSQQAASIEETSAAMNETSAMIRQTVENTFQAKELTDDASKTMIEASLRDIELMQSMNKLSASSDEISKIVSTISDIAFQTNILSLNASVEATRAGEAGRSFMVVAEEVRSLAQKSAQSASDTDVMVRNNKTLTGKSVENSDIVNRMMTEVGEKVQKTAELLNDIAVASEEQSKGIEQINIAMVEMEKATQSSAAISEESAAEAAELQNQAHHLQQVYENIHKLIYGVKQ